MWLPLFAAFCSVLLCSNGQQHDADYYTAGVVEFRPAVFGLTSQEIVSEHLQAYKDIILSAAANSTDIIVFPEGTLNNALQPTHVPSPTQHFAPCDDDQSGEYADFLVQLSCVARTARKYVLINLLEHENCTAVSDDPRPCAANGLNVYNTNVVFDRSGVVISRYRKVHIYLEAKNTTYLPEFAIFDTDFGVRFAHFICFDMLFYTPAQELLERLGIQHFLYPSMFYSELPFLSAVQLQQSWAWANDVNLLAAGASLPQAGMTGSGIYAGEQGALAASMVGGAGDRQLYVAQLPKRRSPQRQQQLPKIAAPQPRVRQTGVKLMKDYQLLNYTTALLQLTPAPQKVQQRLCDAVGFCCDFNIATKPLNESGVAKDSVSYQYRLAVFNDARHYEQIEWSSLQICAVIACTGSDIDSCGELFVDGSDVRPKFNFTTLEIVGDFDKAEKLLLMPNSLDEALYPLEAEAVQWRVQDKGSYYTVRHAISRDVNDLLTFGIYANYYDRSMALPTTKFDISFVILLTCVMLLSMARLLPRRL